ncbi:MAG: FAD-binding oxidoreductase [Armatimonadota bacterium]|nr:FAD-binding oxidoreductase [Armatimonadota bacterium]
MSAADVVVIGGGCTGTSAAFWLASRHRQRVVLLEQRTVGSGPTGRSSGIVRMHYSFEPLIRLALRSREVFERFERVVGGNADFRRTGFLLLAPAGQEAMLEANVRLQQRLGVATRLLDRKAIERLDPRLRTDDTPVGAYEPDSGYADGYATATAFAAAARRAGAEIREHTPAVRLLVGGGRIGGIQTPAGRIDAATVLVAGGPWTRRLLAPLGVEAPIRTTRHQVVLLEAPPRVRPLDPVLVDLATGIYVRPDVGGQFMVGSVEERPEEEVFEDAFNEGTDFDFVERVSRRLVHRVPAFAGVAVKGGYASLYDVTPDWQPILGAVPGIEGLFVAAGFSGHGFKLSPALGECLAALMVEGRPPIDLSMFRITRFQDGALIHSPYAHGIVG